MVKLIFMLFEAIMTNFKFFKLLFLKNIDFKGIEFKKFFQNIYISITKYIKSVIFLF
jgi:hypothetical protein